MVLWLRNRPSSLFALLIRANGRVARVVRSRIRPAHKTEVTKRRASERAFETRREGGVKSPLPFPWNRDRVFLDLSAMRLHWNTR